jgi:hypothetical protein
MSEFKVTVNCLCIARVCAPVVGRVRPGVLPVVHGNAVCACAFVIAGRCACFTQFDIFNRFLNGVHGGGAVTR